MQLIHGLIQSARSRGLPGPSEEENEHDSRLREARNLVPTSRSAVLDPAALASSGSLLKMQILRAHPRPTKSESVFYFSKISQGLGCTLSLEKP